MKDELEMQLRKDLRAEIEALEKRYKSLMDFLAGAQMDEIEVAGTLRAYKDNLSTVSVHVLTLYQLKGQRTKITWDSLLTNIDTALVTIQNSPRSNPRAAIEMALRVSEPKIEDVMAYLDKLKLSL